MKIEGASGGNVADVSTKQRLLVEATQRPLRQEKALDEDAYIVYSNAVEFTVSTESDLLYLVNKDTQGRNLIITDFSMFISGSTGGSAGYSTLGFYKNPTAGPSTVPGILSNSNFQSAKTVTLDLYAGDGSTKVLAGTPINLPIQQEITSQYSFTSDTVLPLNQGIGFTITPPASNTSMKVSFIISFFMEG